MLLLISSCVSYYFYLVHSVSSAWCPWWSLNAVLSVPHFYQKLLKLLSSSFWLHAGKKTAADLIAEDTQCFTWKKQIKHTLPTTCTENTPDSTLVIHTQQRKKPQQGNAMPPPPLYSLPLPYFPPTLTPYIIWPDVSFSSLFGLYISWLSTPPPSFREQHTPYRHQT